MQDGEDLATFIEEQRAKLEYDRDRLKNNPPSSITNNSFNRQVSGTNYSSDMTMIYPEMKHFPCL